MFKSMLIVFFDIGSIIMENWVSDGATVSQRFLKLCEKWSEDRGHSCEKMVFNFIRTLCHWTHNALTWPPPYFTWSSTMWLLSFLYTQQGSHIVGSNEEAANDMVYDRHAYRQAWSEEMSAYYFCTMFVLLYVLCLWYSYEDMIFNYWTILFIRGTGKSPC